MSTYTSEKASPFTRAVIKSIRKLYPEALADKSFDNTGLLLEAPFNLMRRQKNSVLLTIDLTRAVTDEAIERKDSIIIAYHPIIFKGLKSLTLANTQQQSLLRLAAEGISVYCPHTAIDAAPGGLNDWLADIVTGTSSEPEPTTRHTGSEDSDSKSAESDDDPFIEKSVQSKAKKRLSSRMGLTRTYSNPTYPQPIEPAQKDSDSLLAHHTRSVIHPIANEGVLNAGIGRILTFLKPVPLTVLINRIARGVGLPKGFPVAIPQSTPLSSITIRTVAICAGSGSHVFPGVNADLYFTGELSHHEALAIIEKGGCVITLFHSNTERGFLSGVLRAQLESQVREEWDSLRAEEEKDGLEEVFEDEEVRVEVSGRDRDPFGMVILQDSQEAGTAVEDGQR